MGSQGQRHTNFLRTVQERDAVPVGMIQLDPICATLTWKDWAISFCCSSPFSLNLCHTVPKAAWLWATWVCLLLALRMMLLCLSFPASNHERRARIILSLAIPFHKESVKWEFHWHHQKHVFQPPQFTLGTASCRIVDVKHVFIVRVWKGCCRQKVTFPTSKDSLISRWWIFTLVTQDEVPR